MEVIGVMVIVVVLVSFGGALAARSGIEISNLSTAKDFYPTLGTAVVMGLASIDMFIFAGAVLISGVIKECQKD